MEETHAFWNRVARDWDRHVGDDGDGNRLLISDPVVWRFAGDVAGRTVLDAGCGTGYLAAKLQQQGASVIGVDLSEAMIQISRAKAPDIDFRVDSCSALETVGDGSIHIVIANYLLMDTPDLEETMKAFHRVLRVNGVAVVVFSHPCFPQGRATASAKGPGIQYHWEFPYFEPRKCVDPPWGHFTSEFIWFHRPLSDYWRAFKTAGFDVVDFEEPRATEDNRHLARDDRTFQKSRSRPYSVAFKLQKSNKPGP